jgi:hypothetical protein
MRTDSFTLSETAIEAAGKVTPGGSSNHLNVEYRNAINRSPSPLAPVKVSPIMSNDKRRLSHIRILITPLVSSNSS